MPGSFAASPAYTPPAADRPPRRLLAYAGLTAAAFAAYILGALIHGGPSVVLAAVGASSCGWSWILSRALFDPAEKDSRWPIAVLLVLLASGATSQLLATEEGTLSEVAGNIYELVGSAALLLTFVEPLNGWRTGLPVAETRFRFAFLAVYAVLVAASILFLRGSPADEMVKIACASTGLLAGGAAVWFRARHPLSTRPKTASIRAATAEDGRLAERIERLLREEEIHATPDLKVADLARMLRQPEYRVTQCVTGTMGFPNFNRLINHHRIEKAKRMLADPDDRRLPILQIAFECGFGSIGPFNRAFKDETGMTPRAFRAAAARTI